MESLITENIKNKFGKFDFNVIETFFDCRCISLTKESKILVLAITYFFPIKIKRLIDARNKIFNGLPVGQTLREESFYFYKQTIQDCVTELPRDLTEKFYSYSNCYASRLYDIIVKEEGIENSFCRIYEIYDLAVQGLKVRKEGVIVSSKLHSNIQNMDRLITKYRLGNIIL